MTHLETFVEAYVSAALFAETHDDEPLDENYTKDDVHQNTLREMREDCSKFIEENDKRLHGLYSLAGYEFWLTRNRHGSGFWDSPEVWGAEDAEKLTEAAHAFGEVTLYVGDDGKIHHS